MIFIKSLGFAWDGLVKAFKEQRNLKIQSVIFLLVIARGIFCGISSLAWCAIILASATDFVSELMNTSIEGLVDMVSPGHNPKAGVVKDMAAATVLVASCFAIVVGFIIFSRYLIS
ncbi:diacylglycerol kinase family protein [Oscillatoria amoena NRMC-F 0135]|nr:diacylglycerol kinase family protein [Oscillatoria amoena NRMC-F 0135]